MSDIKILEIRNPVLAVLISSLLAGMALLSVLDIRHQSRDLAAAFSGTVLEKGVSGMGSDIGLPDYRYYLIIETPEGKRVKRYCHWSGYVQCQVGDLVVKEAGREHSVRPRDRKSLQQLLDEDFPQDARTAELKELLRKANGY